MPTIYRKPNGSYEVQWMRHRKRHSKTFKTRAEARKYAAEVELQKDKKSVCQMTFADYHAGIASSLAPSTEKILHAIRGYPIYNMRLADITKEEIQKFIDFLLKSSTVHGKPFTVNSVKRYIFAVTTVLRKAMSQKLIESVPPNDLLFPRGEDPRERAASDEDIAALLKAVDWDGKTKPKNLRQTVVCMFMFACRTGMRRGEILKLEESWIDKNVIYLPAEATKTKSARYVGLNAEAMKYLDLLRPLPIGMNLNSFSSCWRKIRAAGNLGSKYDSKGRMVKQGLNFHDSRATFCTWAASPNPKTGAPRLDVLALARQTGHKSLQMLQRYYRPTPQDVAKLLDE